MRIYNPFKNPPKPVVSILTLIILFFVITNFIWLAFDTLPPSWDQSCHMSITLKYFTLMFSNQPLSHKLQYFLSAGENYYPPFFHVSAIPIAVLFGLSKDNLIFVNFFYLILFVLSMYGIGRVLFNRRVGVLSAATVLLYPIIYALSRQYLIDFALVAMVTAVQYLILKSEGGLKSRCNILLGIMSGFALLTKPVAFIFFLPSWLLIFIMNFRKRRDLLPLLATLTICLFIISFWYLFNYAGLIAKHRSYQHIATKLEMDPIAFIPSLLWYANVLIRNLISPVLAFFSLLGLTLFFKFDKRWKAIMTLALWGIPAFLILVVTPNKDARYITPILPIFAFLTVGGIDTIKTRSIRNMLYSFIITFGLVQFVFLSFMPWASNFEFDRHPVRQNWKIKEILVQIDNYVGKKGLTIGVLPNLPYFNGQNFIFYTSLYGLPYEIIRLGDCPITKDEFDKCDIFITTTPPISIDFFSENRDDFYKIFRQKGSKNLGFVKIAQFDLPNNQKALVFKNIN